MKHVVKILSLLVAVSALWIALLQAAIIPQSHAWLLPIYFVVSLGCYGLLMVGIGLMQFPTCPEEAVLLQHDIAEAKEFLNANGIDVELKKNIFPNFLYFELKRKSNRRRSPA